MNAKELEDAEINFYAWDIFRHCAPNMTPEEAWAKGAAWRLFQSDRQAKNDSAAAGIAPDATPTAEGRP